MDGQKVIKGMELLYDRLLDAAKQDSIAMLDALMVENAIVLLKEQEAKQAIKQTYHVMMNRDYENPVEVTRYDWLCPTCKSLLCRDIDVIDDNYHFCKVCGQAVKWE